MPLTAQEFTQKYYYRDDLIKLCKELDLPAVGSKVKLEKIILNFLNGEILPATTQTKKRKWVQDRLGLDCEVTENYKSNQATRDFFKSVIGPNFHFNGAVMNYKKLNPTKFVTYQDLVDEYLADKVDQKKGIMTSERYYKGNRYNKFVRLFYADLNNKGKTRNQMIEQWNKLKNSGKVNEL